MTEQQNRIETLASKYWDATITNIEEQELRQLLAKEQQLDDELKALQIMLGAFEVMTDDYKDVEISRSHKKSYRIVKLVSTFVAAAVVLVFGFVSLNNIKQKSEPEIYCYINGEPITDVEIALEQTKYFEHISELSETMISLESLL
ncbi:MAG: hypothetical protein R3Y26_01710 [Rikenellaceae bacterium]